MDEDQTTCGDPALNADLTAQYGNIRYCALLGTQWVITTLGLNGKDEPDDRGVIAVYACPPDDGGCLGHGTPHPISQWKVVEPPYPGVVGLLGSLLGNCIFVDNGGHQMGFDLTTDTFVATCPLGASST